MELDAAAVRRALESDLAAFEAASARQPLSARLRSVEYSARLAAVGLVAWHQMRLMFSSAPISTPHVAVAVLLGVYLADLLSGVGHMVFDFTELDAVPASKRPLLQYLAFGFQFHHAVPSNWTRHDIFAMGIMKTGLIIFVVMHLILILVTYLSYSTVPFELSTFALVTWISMSWGMLLCQVGHAAAHHAFVSTPFSPLISFLQKCRILLRPEDHQQHHLNFDRNFCIITGWANPLLNFMSSTKFAQGLIPEAMQPAVQRQVYLNPSGSAPALKPPFFEMFPSLRKGAND